MRLLRVLRAVTVPISRSSTLKSEEGSAWIARLCRQRGDSPPRHAMLIRKQWCQLALGQARSSRDDELLGGVFGIRFNDREDLVLLLDEHRHLGSQVALVSRVLPSINLAKLTSENIVASLKDAAVSQESQPLWPQEIVQTHSSSVRSMRLISSCLS